MISGPLTRRVILSVVAIAGLAGGSFALAVAGGHLKLAHAKPSLRLKVAVPLTVVGLAPGDTVQRVTVLQNRGARTIRRIRFELAEKGPAAPGGRVTRAPVGAVTPDGFRWMKLCTTKVTTRGSKKKRVTKCRTALQRIPSPLVTDPAGLRVTVERCPKPWIKRPGTPAVFDCPKRATIVLASTKVPAKAVLRHIPKVKPKGRLHLRMTITLPANAGNQLQGRATTLVPKYVVLGPR